MVTQVAPSGPTRASGLPTLGGVPVECQSTIASFLSDAEKHKLIRVANKPFQDLRKEVNSNEAFIEKKVEHIKLMQETDRLITDLLDAFDKRVSQVYFKKIFYVCIAISVSLLFTSICLAPLMSPTVYVIGAVYVTGNYCSFGSIISIVAAFIFFSLSNDLVGDVPDFMPSITYIADHPLNENRPHNEKMRSLKELMMKIYFIPQDFALEDISFFTRCRPYLTEKIEDEDHKKLFQIIYSWKDERAKWWNCSNVL